MKIVLHEKLAEENRPIVACTNRSYAEQCIHILYVLNSTHTYSLCGKEYTYCTGIIAFGSVV